MRKHLTLYLMLIVTSSYAVVSRAATPDGAPFWTGQGDTASFTKLQEIDWQAPNSLSIKCSQ